MPTVRQEFAQLVHSTLQFIKEDSLPIRDTPIKTPLSNKAAEIPVKKTASNWDLQPMSSPLTKKAAQQKQTKELFIPVRLVLEKEDAEHRLLLENLSRAITQHFVPASVELEEQFKWDALLVLLPCTSARKKIAHAEPHHIYKIDSCTLLTLENLDRYLIDRNLKLSLWQIVKMYPFKSLLPSNS